MLKSSCSSRKYRPVIEVEESTNQEVVQSLEKLEQELEELYKRSKTVISLQGKLHTNAILSSYI
jgi:hypothetical protein